MRTLRFATRAVLAGLHVLLAVVLSLVFLPARPGAAFSRFQQRLMCWLMGRCLRLLHVRVRVRGEPAEGARLIVSNHVSWFDILIIGSVCPSCFLSKSEVRRWFVFGFLAARFGTIFIERGSGAGRALDAISGRLSQGMAVAVFPEGTTSDGSKIGPFYPRMLAAAIDTGIPVQPVVLRYPDGDGVNTLVPFVRDQPLSRHLAPLLKEKSIEAVISFTPPIDSRESDRRRLADQSRAAIVREFENIGGAA